MKIKSKFILSAVLALSAALPAIAIASNNNSKIARAAACENEIAVTGTTTTPACWEYGQQVGTRTGYSGELGGTVETTASSATAVAPGFEEWKKTRPEHFGTCPQDEYEQQGTRTGYTVTLSATEQTTASTSVTVDPSYEEWAKTRPEHFGTRPASEN